MPRRKLIKDSFGFALAQYLVRAALMLRGLIAARLLGPQAFGAWNALQIMLDYGSFASAGTQQGLDQMVPARLVARDEAATRRLKQAALANILVLTLLFAAACLVWATAGSSRVLDAWGVWGVALGLACVLCVNLAYYMLSILRSHDRMSSVSQWFMVQSLIGALLGLGLIPWIGMWGLLIGWFTGCVVSLVQVIRESRGVAPLVPRFAAESLQLILIGFPMFVQAGSMLVMRSLDRIIILRYLGTEGLGHYSLSVMVLTFLLYLPDSIAYVVYPRLLHRFSQEGGRPEAIGDRVRRVMQVMAVFVPLLSGLAFLWARDGVAFALPRFLPGVSAMRILCFGAGALAIANLSSLVLMTVGRRMWLVPAALFSVALGAALELGAAQAGYGMEGVALATFATFVISGTLLLVLALASVGMRSRAIAGLALRILMPIPIAVGLAWVCDHGMPFAGDARPAFRLGRMAAGSLVFAGLYLVAASPFARGAGLQGLIAELDPPVIGPLLRRLGWLGVEPEARP